MDIVMELLMALGASGQIILGVLVGCTGAYLKRRLENLASKQDLNEITDVTESVKSRYAQDLWVNQQKAIIFKEDYRLKLETFLRAMKTLTKFLHTIEELKVCACWREIYNAGSVVLKENNLDSNKQHELYVEYREKAIAAQIPYREALAEFSELKVLFSVYFDGDLVERLNDIEVKGKIVTSLLWVTDKFELSLREIFRSGVMMQVAQREVAQNYEVEWHKHMPDEEINDFFRMLRADVKETRSRMLSSY